MKQKQLHMLMIFATVLFVTFIAGFMLGKAKSTPEPYTANATTISEDHSKNDSVLDYKININTANAEQLTMLDGIGEALADRIVAYRTENGLFRKIEDIMNVSGIGPKKFQQISDFITIGG